MIYAIAGLPGDGKSYLATSMAIDAWKKKPDRKIFSNFPIKWKNHSSLIWKPEYVSEDIFDAMIIIDEAWRDFNSRQFKQFSEDAHLMFACNRHNGVDLIVIAQSIQRIDTVIREICNYIYVTQCLKIPKLDKPLWFTVDVYNGIKMLEASAFAGKNAISKTFRVRFKKEIADAYDTKQFRKDSTTPFEGEFWYPELSIEAGREHGSSRIRSIFRNHLGTAYRSLHSRMVLIINSSKRLKYGYDTLNRIWSDVTDRLRIADHIQTLRTEKRTKIIRGIYQFISSGFRRLYQGRLGKPGSQDTGMATSRSLRTGRTRNNNRRQAKMYHLWEPRSLIKEIAHRNWQYWRPIFIQLGLEPEMREKRFYCEC